MTAAVRLPLGDIRDCPESWGMFAQIVAEVIRLGQAEGIPLADSVVDQVIAFGRGLESGSLSSLHHDMTHGKKMELDTLHGTVIRRAARLGVAVPTCEAIYGILRPWAVRNGG
jgi:2-dehydropantoate 2-reductase